MEKYFKLEFEKGEIFKAKLQEDVAPKTCEAFLDSLPFSSTVLNGSFCGHAFYIERVFDLDLVENPIAIGVQPGEIFLDTNVNKAVFEGNIVSSSVGIAYSSKVLLWNWTGWTPSNLFAKIVENDIAELYRVGRRIFWGGREGFKCSLL